MLKSQVKRCGHHGRGKHFVFKYQIMVKAMKTKVNVIFFLVALNINIEAIHTVYFEAEHQNRVQKVYLHVFMVK